MSQQLVRAPLANWPQDASAFFVVPCDHVSETSPSGRYQLEIEAYAFSEDKQKREDGDTCVATVIDRHDNSIVASIRRFRDDRFWHAWIARNDVEYLVCTENAEGGQTVLDLTNRKLASITCEKEDPFIWTDFQFSTNATLLALYGCYWACNYETCIYDFRQPLSLPLLKLAHCRRGKFVRWIGPSEYEVSFNDGKTQIVEVGYPK